MSDSDHKNIMKYLVCTWSMSGRHGQPSMHLNGQFTCSTDSAWRVES